MPTVNDILKSISQLSAVDQSHLRSILLSSAFVNSLNIEQLVSNERFANGRVCPICGSVSVVRNGHRADGVQRFICRDCQKSFVATTNSIVAGTQKDLSVWEQYISCMMQGLSIRKTAEICGIHRNTAFYWRHKILDALQNMADNVTLNGIVEADETFFRSIVQGKSQEK